MQENILHYIDDLIHYHDILSQYEFRKDVILGTLGMNSVDFSEIQIVMGRGGLTFPLKSGIYEVCDRMLTHVRRGIFGQHASNLGPILAYAIADEIPGAKAYIADPVVTDELDEVARISGHPRFERRSIFHALNQKAIARLYAQQIRCKYTDLNLIIAHMGGGVSIGLHKNGRVVDVNNALDGEGPFSPERSGTLPVGQIIDACFSGNFSIDEMRQMVVGEGGLAAYLKTNSMLEIYNNAKNGSAESAFYVDAFVYQMAKAIGEMAPVVDGNIDAILLTGGIAYNKEIVEKISCKVRFIAPVVGFPGEDEMKAMAMNAMLMIRGELPVQNYSY